MAVQHDLSALLPPAEFDADRFIALMTTVPGALFGLALEMDADTWATGFPDSAALDEADGWLALGSEEYPQAPGVGFELAFERAGSTESPALPSDLAPGMITQLSLQIRVHAPLGAKSEAERLRASIIDAIAKHFGARPRRGRALALPGGPLTVSPVTEWKSIYAGFELAWSMADQVGTTLVME